jgi:sensor histidine kinase regulating citrate/malate metabolism
VPAVILGDEDEAPADPGEPDRQRDQIHGEGPGAVELSAEGDPAALVIRVEDTGIGLNERAKSRVFEPFYQQENWMSATAGRGSA